MMETVEVERSSGADSFASLLAGFAAPGQRDSIEWSVEGLAEDIATISYESAVRSPARNRATEAHGSLTEMKDRDGKADGPKSASVTIRLTRAECNQLHARAAEAGMTISAYLRSCIFEVEALRAQVKEALAQFSSAAAASPRKEPEKPVASGQNWRSRLFPRRSEHRPAEQA